MEDRLKKEREHMDLMLLQVKQYANNSDQGVLQVDKNITSNIVEEFFEKFWRRKIAYNPRKREQVVETMVEIADKIGVSYTIGKIVYDLQDECEPYRRMVMETVDKILGKLGGSDIDSSIGEVLMESIIYAYREQTTDYDTDDVILNGFCRVLKALHRDIVRPYLEQIYLMMKCLMEENNTKQAKVRLWQQVADLCNRIRWECEEEQFNDELLSEFPHLIL
ncbi:Splicing factor 3b subunit [Thalictrum thalictroides]|uniref:Splicing factor 3b subunit n=1 Tax=Thalictrum thalictroides TaxID=46969 RepID=A0A7J6X2K1_THATH|nr:Splicing factor 3b subunit [Thalictrum thalictroides]